MTNDAKILEHLENARTMLVANYNSAIRELPANMPMLHEYTERLMQEHKALLSEIDKRIENVQIKMYLDSL